MAQETLNRIQEAEMNARNLVQDARSSGAALLADAREKAQKYKEELVAKARADAADAVAKVQEGLEPALEDAGRRAEAVIGQMQRSVSGRKDAAVKLVIDSII